MKEKIFIIYKFLVFIENNYGCSSYSVVIMSIYCSNPQSVRIMPCEEYLNFKTVLFLEIYREGERDREREREKLRRGEGQNG